MKWGVWFLPGLLFYIAFIFCKLPVAGLVVLGGVFLGFPAAIITSFAIGEIKDKKMKRILFDTNIKIVQTTLSEKSINSGVDSDGDPTNYYYFEFHYKFDDFCYKFSERVSSFKFKKHNIGDGCYLVLFFNGKEYKVDCIYWENEILISENLRPYMLAMSQVAKTNQIGILWR